MNFGANPATSVGAVRAADFDRLDEADARALYERLERRFKPAEGEPPTLTLYQAQAVLLGL